MKTKDHKPFNRTAIEPKVSVKSSPGSHLVAAFVLRPRVQIESEESS